MFLKISLVALTVTLIGISTAKPSFGPNKGLEEALESIADFDEDNDEKSSMDESTKAIVLKLLMQQAKLQLDEGGDDYTEGDYDDEDNEDYMEAKSQFWGTLAKNVGKKICNHLRSSPKEELEQTVIQWLDSDEAMLQDNAAEFERWKIGRRIKKFFPKLRNFGRKVCDVFLPAAKLQLQTEPEDNDGDDVEVQFLRLIKRKYGNRICQNLRSPKNVLEQNINDWIQKNDMVMQNDVAKLEHFSFLHRIRNMLPRLWGFGRKVCDTLRPTESQVMEPDGGEDEVVAQFWKKIAGKILKRVGTKICNRIRSKPDALEESVDHWLQMNASVMEYAEMEKFGRRIKKFFRKIGGKLCDRFLPGVQEYDDGYEDDDDDGGDAGDDLPAAFFQDWLEHLS